MEGERRGAGGNSGIERRPVNPDICYSRYRLDKCSRHDNGRRRQCSDRDMQPRHLRTARHCHRVVARGAGIRPKLRKTVGFRFVVVIVVGCRYLKVVMRGRAVVVFGMIVAGVLVHMQSRPQGG